MQFTSYEFALFFVACFAVSWSFVGHNILRKCVLLVSSYLFVSLLDWRMAVLLFSASSFNYCLGHLISEGESQNSKRIYSFFAILANLLLFLVFNYYSFFIDVFTPMMTEFGFERDLTWLKFALPVGISFFILQAISYLVDIYRGDAKAEKSFLNFHLFMTFFPKLVAGPLVKANNFLPQLSKQGSLTRDMVGFGLLLILIGLVKKLVVADMLATRLVDPVFTDPTAYSAFDVIISMYALAIQLYCDISGYCDIAIGCSSLLGIKISQNFDRPYGATSLIQFWARWHRSLSGFFVDYVYKPMGGRNGGILSAGRNIVLTFLLAAWWHGAGLNFVAFALIHSLSLVVTSLLLTLKTFPTGGVVAYGSGHMGQFLSYGDRCLHIVGPVISTLITFHAVCLGWLFLRSEDLTVVGQIFSAMANGDLSSQLVSPYLLILLVCSFSMHLLPKNFWPEIGRHFSRLNSIYLGLIFGIGVLIIQILASPDVKPFFYGSI